MVFGRTEKIQRIKLTKEIRWGGKVRKLMRVVSVLLGKEKRGPSAQSGGEETEVAGLRRANVGAGAGRSPVRRGGPQPPGAITGRPRMWFGELPGNAQARSAGKQPSGLRPYRLLKLGTT